MSTPIILVIHADYKVNGTRDPSLSCKGYKQSFRLAEAIQNLLKPNSEITIWTSPAKRALGTISILERKLNPVQTVVFDEL